MSWTIDDAEEDGILALEIAIKNAKGKDIIMFCAPWDEGRDDETRPVYPYSFDRQTLIRIGATDQFGSALAYVPKPVDYLLPGQGLADKKPNQADIPKEQRNSGEGSLEATALGAGLAALVLECFGAVHGDAGINEVESPTRMKTLFDFFSFNNQAYISAQIFQTAAKKVKPKKGEIPPVSVEEEITKRLEYLIASCRRVLSDPRNAQIQTAHH
jgi:hypothetical protein